MTSLGIYGDGVADDCSYLSDRATITANAWSYLLGQIHDSYQNYALRGSSLYFSYQQFINTHSIHDKIVFVVTEPGRWPRSIPVHGKRPIVCKNSSHAEQILQNKKNLSDENRDILRTAKKWYDLVRVWEHELAMHDLMIEEIQRLRPDALMFGRDDRSGALPDYLLRFSSIVDVMIRNFHPQFLSNAHDSMSTQDKIYLAGWRERPDRMICHMSTDLNRLVFEQMKKLLMAQPIDLRPFSNYRDGKTWDTYYTSINRDNP